MAAREIDFMLLPRFAVTEFTAASLRYRTLHRDVPGILMSSDHPLAKKATITREDLQSLEHIAFSVEAMERGHRDHDHDVPEIAWHAQFHKNAVLWINHVALAPELLVGNKLICLMGYDMAKMMARSHPLIARTLPFETVQIEEGIAWSPIFDSDAAHKWLRTAISTLSAFRSRSSDS